ncbi:hypothetical protein [Microbacterium gorillae]|uniref:hypothetical protein n=1 Tax=Microbacterium gorillae TaxID=1231063 RepID=UPI003D98BFF6
MTAISSRELPATTADRTSRPMRLDVCRGAPELMALYLRELQRSPALCLTVVGTAIGPTAAVLGLDLLLRGDGAVFAASAPTLTALIGLIVPMSLLTLPLVRLRDRGTLRLIATTAARQFSAMLAGLTVAALGTATAMTVLVGALVIFAPLGPRTLVGALTSAVFGIGVASLVGACVRQSTTARALAVVVPAVAVLASDALPWGRIFPSLTALTDLLPTAIIGQAVSAGSASASPPDLALLSVAIVSIVVCLASVRWCRA